MDENEKKSCGCNESQKADEGTCCKDASKAQDESCCKDKEATTEKTGHKGCGCGCN